MLAMGSPVLATYSPTLTILNTHWLASTLGKPKKISNVNKAAAGPSLCCSVLGIIRRWAVGYVSCVEEERRVVERDEVKGVAIETLETTRCREHILVS